MKPERQWRPVTISIPDELLFRLDCIRHDVSRSKIIQKLIQGYVDQMTAAVELQ